MKKFILAIFLIVIAAAAILVACQSNENGNGNGNGNGTGNGNGFSGDPNFHIYLCFGQSNMWGSRLPNDIIPDNLKDYTNERFQVMGASDTDPGRLGNWYIASPPLPANNAGICPADNFGRTLVEKITDTNIKIGVIVVAIPGAGMDAFVKSTSENFATVGSYSWVRFYYPKGAYARLVEMGTKAQEDGVIKGILMHQGEADAGSNGPLWRSKVKSFYDDLLKDLKLQPNSIPLIAGELGPLFYQWNTNAQIHALTELSAQFHVISSLGIETFEESELFPQSDDRVHFSPAGQMEFGKRYAEKMFDLLYK